MHRSVRFALIAVTLATAAALTAGAQVPQKPPPSPGMTLPAGVQRVTAVEGITEYKWPNGLRVLLFPDPSKQTITVNITYLVGSRHENYGETGMAHLLEHLVFKGTPRHPNIPQELTAHGARPNGTTWFDRTNYFETFQATDPNLAWALDLEADRMVNSFIAKKDLDSEMTVVRNEFEAGENSPQRVLMSRVLSTAFLWHNYGKTTIGARADLENVPINRLQAFYRTYYQPDNAVLLVAGRFDTARTIALINTHFGPIPKPARVLPATYTAEPTQDGERSVTLRRVGDVQAVSAVYHVPSGTHPDYPAIDVLTAVLGDTTAGRLHKNLVETKKAAFSFGVGFQLREPGVVFFGADVRTDASLDAARDALLDTLEGVRTTPVTQAEVDRARTMLLKNIELSLNSSEQVGLELSEWAAMGDWRLLFLHRDRLSKVTVADVQRVATAYLKPANRTLGLFIPTPAPDRAEIPAAPDVAAMLKDYRGGDAVAAGEVFDPAPSNIESRTTRPDIGGVKLALLPKKTRGNSVVLTMTLRFGDAVSMRGRRTAADLTGDMLMRGTVRRTRQQVQDEIDKLKANVFVGGGSSASVYVETTRENLPAVLRLVAEILKEPSFPASEFEIARQEWLAGYDEGRNDPASVASRALNRHLRPYPKDDIRHTATLDEDIAAMKAVTLDDVKRFYQDFYGASNAQLSIVGDFDAAGIQNLAGELFGSWKSPRPYVRMTEAYAEIPAINETIRIPDKANAVFFASMRLNVRNDDPDWPALVLGNYMLGGGFLNSRLATRVRQKDGLSYGVGSSITANALDRIGQFMANAIYAPENVVKLEAAIKEEIARVMKDGFTAAEVAAAKTGWLQIQQVTRAQDGSLAGKLTDYRHLNRTLAWDAEFERKIAALTPAEILAAMRKHIDPAKLSIIKAGSFK